MPIIYSFLSYLAISVILAQSVSALTPPQEGLVIWLDANDEKTLTLAPKKGVTSIKNKGTNGGAMKNRFNHGAWLIPNCLGGKPNLRFTGPQNYVLEGGLKGVKNATVFVVFRRVSALSGGNGWQRLVSSGQGNRGLFVSLGEKSDELKPEVVREVFTNVNGENFYLGTHDKNSGGHLKGDVAEVLVYSRSFYVEDQMQEVVSYLTKKWGFKEQKKDEWTRVGPLGEAIKHVRHDLPLSDQKNVGKWKLFAPMCDEFDASELDANKWWDHHPTWFGRAPGRFLPENVKVKDGELQLTMRKHDDLPTEVPVRSQRYKGYSSASVVSKEPTIYGYFEIKAKPMNSSGSSAFWLTGRCYDKEKKGNVRTEIDIFELGGKAKGKENYYNMNMHIFQMPGDKRHWNSGAVWKAPFRLADDFHIYGLEWGKESIRYFVDGHLVRELKNTHCHSPMALLFDSETMFDWLGVPENTDLPSTYRIKYVRSWKNPQMWEEWQERFSMSTPIAPGKETGITRYHRSLK